MESDARERGVRVADRGRFDWTVHRELSCSAEGDVSRHQHDLVRMQCERRLIALEEEPWIVTVQSEVGTRRRFPPEPYPSLCGDWLALVIGREAQLPIEQHYVLAGRLRHVLHCITYLEWTQRACYGCCGRAPAIVKERT